MPTQDRDNGKTEVDFLKENLPYDTDGIPLHKQLDFKVSCNEIDKLRTIEGVRYMARYYLAAYMRYRSDTQQLFQHKWYSFTQSQEEEGDNEILDNENQGGLGI
jgi:hypothetical protein